MYTEVNIILSEHRSLVKKFIIRVLRVGPIPNHIAFSMYGNRRYAEKRKLEGGAGHDAGILTLILFMLIYIALLTSIVNRFAGNLQLLTAGIRDAANKPMEAAVDFSKGVLTICIAYNCTNEILHAIQESCEGKCNDRIQEMIISHHHGDDHNLIN
ncbi:Decaprenyl diphosphate synthase-like - like 5 [Theobroma cacao]|nr:Decaprenyl diphosphate synthase-like - like 5 [Theobroma cacao]